MSHEVGVPADIDHPSLVDHGDAIGLLNRRQPVGDHQRRPAGHQPVEGLLDSQFAFRVERAGRLVEHRVARLGEQHPREREPLLLADRQHLRPVLLGVQAAEPLGERAEVDPLEQRAQRGVVDAPRAVGVEQLVRVPVTR